MESFKKPHHVRCQGSKSPVSQLVAASMQGLSIKCPQTPKMHNSMGVVYFHQLTAYQQLRRRNVEEEKPIQSQEVQEF